MLAGHVRCDIGLVLLATSRSTISSPSTIGSDLVTRLHTMKRIEVQPAHHHIIPTKPCLWSSAAAHVPQPSACQPQQTDISTYMRYCRYGDKNKNEMQQNVAYRSRGLFMQGQQAADQSRWTWVTRDIRQGTGLAWVVYAAGQVS